jgi:osmotically-inducible protein OsmY
VLVATSASPSPPGLPPGGSAALSKTPTGPGISVAARRVYGVTSVSNHLAVVLPHSDYRDDTALTTAANNALALAVLVPDTVKATAQDGNIRLTGTARFGFQRYAAELAVGGLIGVRNIKDDIGIVWDTAPVNVATRVRDALDRYGLVPDDTDVTVDASGGTVTLIGHVRTWAEHDAIIDAAWMGTGVSDVRDDLQITG